MTDDSPTRRDHVEMVLLLAVGVVLTFGFATTLDNVIDPMWVWGGDLCPDERYTCGTLPTGLMLSAIPATATLAIGIQIPKSIRKVIR